MRLTHVLAGLLSCCCATVATGQESNPPPASPASQPARLVPPGAVRAVVVKSWGSGSTSLVWDHLNTNWADYGSIPIFIDATSLHEIANLTLADLQSSGADVVIVSDPAGGLHSWTAVEVAALENYALQGHPLIGTYLMFQWNQIDNRALAPLWGLRSDLDYTPALVPNSTTASILSPADCLFLRLAGSYHHGGYEFDAVPAGDQSWDPVDLVGAGFLARSADGREVVTRYESGALRATYFSAMPEYQLGTAIDATQLVYNAIACFSGVTQTTPSSWARVKTLFR